MGTPQEHRRRSRGLVLLYGRRLHRRSRAALLQRRGLGTSTPEPKRDVVFRLEVAVQRVEASYRALSYTPGYTNNAVDFMRRRSLETHGQWLEPLLAPGQRILDLGCGPGTITIGVARRIAPGEVIGIDPESSQVEAARSLAARENFPPKFEIGRAGELPFTDESFDGAYAHAVFEHLSNPHNALLDLRRKLRRGGFAALRSPDWGGFLVHPLSPDVQQALALYQEIQAATGGDIHAGRKLGGWLRDAGFK